MNLNTTFNKIYTSNRWIFGSGTGSIAINNEKYIRFLQNFLDAHPDITNVLDVGCGDWQIGREIDWANRRYIGIDVSDHALTETKRKFESARTNFHIMDAANDELPDADLIIIKDVLEHLSFAAIQRILDKTHQYEYILIQNDIGILETINFDIESGGYRKLDVTKSPFWFEAKLVSTYTEFHLVVLMLFEIVIAMTGGVITDSALVSCLMFVIGIILTLKIQPLKGIFLKTNEV